MIKSSAKLSISKKEIDYEYSLLEEFYSELKEKLTKIIEEFPIDETTSFFLIKMFRLESNESEHFDLITFIERIKSFSDELHSLLEQRDLEKKKMMSQINELDLKINVLTNNLKISNEENAINKNKIDDLNAKLAKMEERLKTSQFEHESTYEKTNKILNSNTNLKSRETLKDTNENHENLRQKDKKNYTSYFNESKQRAMSYNKSRHLIENKNTTTNIKKNNISLFVNVKPIEKTDKDQEKDMNNTTYSNRNLNLSPYVNNQNNIHSINKTTNEINVKPTLDYYNIKKFTGKNLSDNYTDFTNNSFSNNNLINSSFKSNINGKNIFNLRKNQSPSLGKVKPFDYVSSKLNVKIRSNSFNKTNLTNSYDVKVKNSPFFAFQNMNKSNKFFTNSSRDTKRDYSYSKGAVTNLKEKENNLYFINLETNNTNKNNINKNNRVDSKIKSYRINNVSNSNSQSYNRNSNFAENQNKTNLKNKDKKESEKQAKNFEEETTIINNTGKKGIKIVKLGK